MITCSCCFVKGRPRGKTKNILLARCETSQIRKQKNSRQTNLIKLGCRLLSADSPFGSESCLWSMSFALEGRSFRFDPFCFSFILNMAGLGHHMGSLGAKPCLEVAGRIAGSSWTNECKVGVREFWTVHFPNHLQDWIYLCRTGGKLKLPGVSVAHDRSGATDHVLDRLNTIPLFCR